MKKNYKPKKLHKKDIEKLILKFPKIKKESLYIANEYMEVVYEKERKNRYISESIR